MPEAGSAQHARVMQYRELLDALPMDAYTHGCILHPELTTDSMIPKYATAEIRSECRATPAGPPVCFRQESCSSLVPFLLIFLLISLIPLCLSLHLFLSVSVNPSGCLWLDPRPPPPRSCPPSSGFLPAALPGISSSFTPFQTEMSLPLWLSSFPSPAPLLVLPSHAKAAGLCGPRRLVLSQRSWGTAMVESQPQTPGVGGPGWSGLWLVIQGAE